MSQFSLTTLTGYVVAAVAAGLGIAVLTGFLNITAQPTARYIFGAVLLLMGGYRFLVTRMKASASKHSKSGLDDEDKHK